MLTKSELVTLYKTIKFTNEDDIVNDVIISGNNNKTPFYSHTDFLIKMIFYFTSAESTLKLVGVKTLVELKENIIGTVGNVKWSVDVNQKDPIVYVAIYFVFGSNQVVGLKFRTRNYHKYYVGQHSRFLFRKETHVVMKIYNTTNINSSEIISRKNVHVTGIPWWSLRDMWIQYRLIDIIPFFKQDESNVTFKTVWAVYNDRKQL